MSITDKHQRALSTGHRGSIHCPNCGSPQIAGEAEYTLEMRADQTEIMYEDRRVFGRCFNPSCYAKFDCTISTPLR